MTLQLDHTPASGLRRGRVGYVPGIFDMFHVGHLNILRHARPHCDWLVAGVVSDENSLVVKGKLPIVPLIERMEILRHVTLVDEVVAETAGSKLEQWEQVHFDVIFKGDDWRGTAKGDRLESQMSAVGVEVVYFPYTVHTSSSLLRGVVEERAGVVVAP